MLLLIRSMKELRFGKLVQVYDESCATLDARSDFYEYLRQVFFKTPGAVYCVWQEGDSYTSALRLEPYRDGWILTGLETGTPFRGQGFAKTLLRAVISWRGQRGRFRLYSHIDRGNGPSIAVHERVGFRKIAGYAVFLDGSATNMAGTYLYEE